MKDERIQLTKDNYDTILPTYLIEQCNIMLDSDDMLWISRPVEMGIYKPKVHIERMEKPIGGTVVEISNDLVLVSMHVVDPILDHKQPGVSISIVLKNQIDESKLEITRFDGLID